MSKSKVLYWFRQDLRLNDNPALCHASRNGTVMPIYIFDDINSKDFKLGAASCWWLHQSLISLNDSLDGNLNFYKGDPEEIILKLIQEYDISHIHWNRCYEPWQISRDSKIKKLLKLKNIQINSDNSSLLWEPWDVTKKDNTPYKVFTPFFQNGCLSAIPPREPINKPRNLRLIQDAKYAIDLKDLKLMPKKNWHYKLAEHWQCGEVAALKRLNIFLESGIYNYKEGRDFPAKQSTSRLSPHLHFGEISPNQVWYLAKKQISGNNNNLKVFLTELGWREFSYNLLYQFPELPNKNWRSKFNKFKWSNNTKLLQLWQQGKTGYPIVDAGMRELWQTGYMHNRVRMIAASFLVKNLLIDWREGEKWFWDCLVDADLASNSASWQWVAGSGADAAPYFRIFNPVTQGQKFDPEGEYTRKYIPELKNIPNKFLFNPFDAPESILNQSGIKLGNDYPMPIVDLKISRQKALDIYNSIKE